MNVRIQLFAVAKQLAGRAEVDVELAEPATISQVRSRLAAAVPSLEPLLKQMRFAVDSQYVTDDTPIPAGAEVACIPPVSGG